MKVGFSLPIFAGAASGAAIREMAQLAEEQGFESLWAADHLLMPVSIATRYEYTRQEEYPLAPQVDHLEVFTTLAAAAGMTRSVKIGSNALIAPYRHPLETAKMLASLDVISGGRLLVGVGVGWMKEEFDALGIPYEERGQRTNEIIDIWTALWTRGRSAYQGRYYVFDLVQSEPKPVQRPHPPILVGGYSNAAMQRVIQRGTGWLAIVEGPDSSYGPTGRFAEDIGLLRKLAEEMGRDPTTIDITGMLFAGPRSDVSSFIRDYEGYERAGANRMIVTFPAVSGDLTRMRDDLTKIAQSGVPLRGE